MNDMLGFVLMLAVGLAKNSTYCMYSACPQGVLRYNCQDFSAALVLELRREGFDAWPVCGWYGFQGRHAWVAVHIDGVIVHIEPQSGKIVTPYYEHQLLDYAIKWGRYPDYRLPMRCLVRGLA